jgi:hypothetical protein
MILFALYQLNGTPLVVTIPAIVLAPADPPLARCAAFTSFDNSTCYFGYVLGRLVQYL